MPPLATTPTRITPVPLFDRDVHVLGALARYTELIARSLSRPREA